jgi:uncharacterized protein YciI
MDFDQLTVALLVLREDAPELDPEAEAALQNAHMAYIARLHEEGHLVAAGPLRGGDQDPLRGLSLLRVDPQRARELKEADPAVRAGRYALRILPWMVPAGAISFAHTRFPRSIAEAVGEPSA